MKQTVLITGTNRGIGFELVKQFSEHKWNVIACCRSLNNATKLIELSSTHPNIQIKKLEVCDQHSIQNLISDLKGQPIDLLINNAGIYRKENEPGNISTEDIIQTFLTNAVAPLKISEALIDNILKSSLRMIVVITSRLGSIGFNTVGGHYSYRASKAAVNMFMKNFSIEWKDKGVRVLLLHPGWVKTDINENMAPLEACESVKGLYTIMMNNVNTAGMYYDYTGEEIPW